MFQPLSSVTSINEAGKEAMNRFQVALAAINRARSEGRITPFVAAERLTYLTGRYEALLDPLQQIAACEAMIQTCERADR